MQENLPSSELRVVKRQLLLFALSLLLAIENKETFPNQ
jgi:hypothetical protein